MKVFSSSFKYLLDMLLEYNFQQKEFIQIQYFYFCWKVCHLNLMLQLHLYWFLNQNMEMSCSFGKIECKYLIPQWLLWRVWHNCCGSVPVLVGRSLFGETRSKKSILNLIILCWFVDICWYIWNAGQLTIYQDSQWVQYEKLNL